jgi:hypothetical protein
MDVEPVDAPEKWVCLRDRSCTSKGHWQVMDKWYLNEVCAIVADTAAMSRNKTASGLYDQRVRSGRRCGGL